MFVAVDDHGRVSTEFAALDVIRWFKVEIDSFRIVQGYDGLDSVGERFKELLEQNLALPLGNL